MSTGPRHGVLELLDVVSDAVVVTDPSGLVVFANHAAHHVWDGHGGLAVGSALVPRLASPQRGAVQEITDRALAGRAWRGELRLDDPEGRPVGTLVGCQVLRHDDTDELAYVLVEEGAARSRVHVTRRLAERLTGLTRVAAELASAEDLEEVTRIVTAEGAHVVGATVGSLSLLEGDSLVLAGIHGGLPGAAARWQRYSVHDPTPAGDVARSGEPLFLAGRAEIHQRYPDLEQAADGERSMVVLPLAVSNRVVGVMSWSFPGRRRLDDAETEFYAVLADSCAQAVERIRAQQDSLDQAARVRFLADATSTLAESLDYQRTLSEVARMVVPAFADWCAIDLVEDGQLRRLAVEHVDPSKVELARQLQERYPARPEDGGAWTVLRTGEPLLVPDVTDAMVAPSARDDEHRHMLLALRLRSVLLVPLVARGTVLGVMSWIMAESDRRYDVDEVPFALDLARRAAIAIDNSQLHTETHEAALRLQRALLPRLPDAVPGWDVTAHYAPSGRTEVGGDFFDVVPVGDDRVVVVTGDVMGRGVRAAAAMAQVRSAIRAYIADDPDPVHVVGKLDRLFTLYDVERLVTLVYLLVQGGDVRMVTAGHPPPALLRSDGRAEYAPSLPGHPLGVATASRTPTTFRVSDGDVLLTYTDGLVERRGESIDDGLDRLLRDLPALREGSLAEGVRALVGRVADHTRDDDVAVLALRRSDAVLDDGDGAMALRLDVGADALSHFRTFVLERLQAWRVPEDVADDVVLATHELVVNAVVHGAPPVDLRLRHDPDSVTVEIEDRSTELPDVRAVSALEERGRGLVVVEAVTSRWGARATTTGKVVWARHDVRREPLPADRPVTSSKRSPATPTRAPDGPVSPASEAAMAVTISSDRRTDGVVVIRVRGDLDLHATSQVRELVGAQVDTCDDVYLDLSGVDFLDSSGLGTLVALRKRAAESGHRLILCQLTGQVSRILRITALTDVFTILPEVPDLRASDPGLERPAP